MSALSAQLDESQRLRASLGVELAEANERARQSAEALGVVTQENGALEAKLGKERARNAKAKEVVLRQQAERKELLAEKDDANGCAMLMENGRCAKGRRRRRRWRRPPPDAGAH